MLLRENLGNGAITEQKIQHTRAHTRTHRTAKEATKSLSADLAKQTLLGQG